MRGQLGRRGVAHLPYSVHTCQVGLSAAKSSIRPSHMGNGKQTAQGFVVGHWARVGSSYLHLTVQRWGAPATRPWLAELSESKAAARAGSLDAICSGQCLLFVELAALKT